MGASFRPYGQSLNELATDTEDECGVVDKLFRKIREGLLGTEATPRVIAVACSVTPHADRLAAVLVLEERTLTDRDLRVLASRLLKCVQGTADLRGAETQSINGAIRRLSRLLRTEHLREIAPLLLEQGRLGRRRAIVAALHRISAPREAVPALLRLFQTTGDSMYLELLARSPEAATVVESNLLLSTSATSYWRIRAIASRLLSGCSTAFADRHPEEFIQAIGWIASKGHQDTLSPGHLRMMDRLVHLHRKNLDVLHACIWTCSKLRDGGRLRRLETMLCDRIGKAPSPAQERSLLH